MSEPLSDDWWHRISAALVRLKKVGARLQESETDLDVEIERRLATHKDHPRFKEICRTVKEMLLAREKGAGS